MYSSELQLERGQTARLSRLHRGDTRRRMVALIQGAYYFVTGVWPLISMRTFEMVTGPKADRWLVRTVGALLSLIGALLLSNGIRQRSANSLSLGVGSAGILTAVDVVYVARRRISPIYLVDALAEIALLAMWFLSRLGAMPPRADHRQPVRA